EFPRPPWRGAQGGRRSYAAWRGAVGESRAERSWNGLPSWHPRAGWPSPRSELGDLLVEEGQRLLEGGPPQRRAGGRDLLQDPPPRHLQALAFLPELALLGRQDLFSVRARLGVLDL